MHKLFLVFTGCTCHKVYFLILRFEVSELPYCSGPYEYPLFLQKKKKKKKMTAYVVDEGNISFRGVNLLKLTVLPAIQPFHSAFYL